MNASFTEKEIIEGCARNERPFQELLYRQHFNVMMHMCMRYTDGDKERAYDILNDGFLRVFKKIHTFEFKGSLEGWIRRLIFHAVSDYFKTHRTYMNNVVLEEYDVDCSTQESALTPLYFDDLMQLINHLPPATREVFRLYAIEGYTHQEIADQQNISVGTSKWHLSAAREKLKAMIDQSNNLRLII